MGYIDQHYLWDESENILELPDEPKFFGETIEDEDIPRLTKHLQNVLSFMVDGREHTLGYIARNIGCSEASASARLRDLRRYGYTINKRRDEITRGLWWYKLTQ